MLYSKNGLYVLMDATDRKLTATMSEDFMDLWKEDVFEVFLWTDERDPSTSSTRSRRSIASCRSWCRTSAESSWAGGRGTTRATGRSARRPASAAARRSRGADEQGWRAEFFIPFELLNPLRNVPPKPGTRWRANFYRMDHDGGKRTQWDWAPVGAELPRVPEIR